MTRRGGNELHEGINYHLSMIKPWSWERHSLNLLLEGGGSTSQEEYPLFVQDLGGLFRMSGFQRYQLSGRYSLFGGLRYIYRVADNDFGALKMPLYLGGSLEQGGGSGTRALTSAWIARLPQVPSMSGWRASWVLCSSATVWQKGGNNMFYLQLGSTFE